MDLSHHYNLIRAAAIEWYAKRPQARQHMTRQDAIHEGVLIAVDAHAGFDSSKRCRVTTWIARKVKWGLDKVLLRLSYQFQAVHRGASVSFNTRHTHHDGGRSELDRIIDREDRDRACELARTMEPWVSRAITKHTTKSQTRGHRATLARRIAREAA